VDEPTLTPLHVHAQYEFIWQFMRVNQIDDIVVQFDGSGDSGDINDICAIHQGKTDDELYNLLKHPLPEGLIPEREQSVFISQPPVTVYDLIHELSNALLGASEAPDWVNNDGGYGELTWIMSDIEDEPPRIEVEYNIRYVHTELTELKYTKFGELDEGDAL